MSKRWVAAFHLCGRATTNSGWHNARTGNTVSRTAPSQSHTFASALIAYIHILADGRAMCRCILQIQMKCLTPGLQTRICALLCRRIVWHLTRRYPVHTQYQVLRSQYWHQTGWYPVPSSKSKVPVLASNWVVDAQYIEVAEHRSNSLLPSSLHFVGARRAL